MYYKEASVSLNKSCLKQFSNENLPFKIAPCFPIYLLYIKYTMLKHLKIVTIHDLNISLVKTL